jgi:hypothetical protein
MLLYAVASSLRVHGESSRDGSERSLNSPENQCSIGFQPVFGSHRQVMFSGIRRSSGLRIKAQGFNPGDRSHQKVRPEWAREASS